MRINMLIELLKYENNRVKYVEYCERNLGQEINYEVLPTTQVLSILKTEELLDGLVESLDLPYFPSPPSFRTQNQQLALWQKYLMKSIQNKKLILLPPGTSKHF